MRWSSGRRHRQGPRGQGAQQLPAAEGRLVVAAQQPGSPQPQPTATATPTPPAGGGPPLGDDLRVTTVPDPPEAVPEGAAFELTDTVAGTGPDTTRYYLAPDSVTSLAERGQGAIPLRDVLMAGAREAAAPSTRTTTVGVPVGTKPGVYHLLACADDRQAIAEPEEGNNCARALDGDQPDEIVVLAYSVGAGSIEMKRKHETDISFLGAVNYLRE